MGAWTMQEIVDIGFTAVDNARDEAGDGPVTRTFDSEIEFQLGAPEHRGRPRLTPSQVAIIRAIWDKKIQQAREGY